VRDWALFIAAPSVWAAWGNLLHSVQTGESAFEHTFGMRLFSYMTERPDLGAPYNNWMAKQSELQNGAVLGSYDFAAHHRVVDVGGGQGATLTAILEANPSVTGVLFDLPQVVSKVTLPETITQRCEIVAGDTAGGKVKLRLVGVPRPLVQFSLRCDGSRIDPGAVASDNDAIGDAVLPPARSHQTRRSDPNGCGLDLSTMRQQPGPPSVPWVPRLSAGCGASLCSCMVSEGERASAFR